MTDNGLDERVRTAAFEWLSQQVVRHGDILPRRLLEEGFELDGIRVSLIGPQGIFRACPRRRVAMTQPRKEGDTSRRTTPLSETRRASRRALQ